MKDQYRPKRVMDLPGRKAIARRDFQTAQMVIPAGTVLTVAHARLWAKITLRGERCPCCHVEPIVSCDVRDLTFLSPDEAPPLPIEPAKIEIHADPTEPNVYRLTQGDRWLAVVQLNGEFTVTQQESIMGAFAGCGHRYPPRAT